MKIVCFDLEGTLAPELWIAIAEHFNLPELRLTTREEPDENKLMTTRLQILKDNKITYSQIIKVIESVELLEGAKNLLDSLPHDYQPVIVTGSYYEFILPLLDKLGSPFAFANYLSIENDMITNYNWRTENYKHKAVEGFKSQNFEVIAVGDSYNDIAMFKAAGTGFFFRSPVAIKSKFPEYPATDDYDELLGWITQ